jgi:FtsH-binding integral membrane protein
MATGPQREYLGRAQAPAGARAADIDVGLRAYMLKVFGLMAAGTAVTGLVAYFGAVSGIYVQLAATPLIWVVVFAPLVFAFIFGMKIQSMRASTAQMLFWAFAALMGLSLSYVFLAYTGTSIARTFFIAAATFAGTALYGYTTKRDLSAMGSFLMMGVIGLVIASIVNLFLASSGLHWAISVLGVLIFTGLTAYDAQNIKEMYYAGDDAEVGTKKAVMGALRLYLDFINLFIFLLQFLGERR